MEKNASENVLPLKRGGFLIKTSSGDIQFGIPPETIKDTMTLGRTVPRIFIVPNYMFAIDLGISLAELEFPIYFNFFIRQQKTRVICTEAQAGRLAEVLAEALTGPAHLDYAQEFPEGEACSGYPDLKREGEYFRTMPIGEEVRRMQLDDVVRFTFFDGDGRAQVGDIEVVQDGDFNVTVHDKGKKIAQIDRRRAIIPRKRFSLKKDILFRPPLFGVTTIGAGHGFDPDSSTSGIIIWINRRGIVVDPPVHSTDKLLHLGVNPKLIDSVILTHCHADHDAGTLQAMMQEGKLNLYTTQTIFNSFMHKSQALTGIGEEHLRKMINFSPVYLGTALNIMGGNFIFNYTLHSIPTISIQVSFHGKEMVYSSDTLNDPEYIGKMYQQGVISKGRYDFLINFPWDKDLILHDAGVAPLHTPVSYLCTLPEAVRKKMYLIHVSADNIPKESGLRIAPTGLSNTVELDVDPSEFDETLELLSVIMNIDIFRDFCVAKIRGLLSVVAKEAFSAGTYIFKKGDRGDKFYIIISGTVEIIHDTQTSTTYSDSDYFGEKAILLNTVRSATVKARTHVRLLSITEDRFMGFVRGTGIEAMMRRLAEFQDTRLRDLLDMNPVFRRLTSTQKIQLHRIVAPVSAPFLPGTVIIEEDVENAFCYYIEEGNVNVFRKNNFFATLGKGSLIGLSSVYNKAAFSHFTIIAKEKTFLHQIKRDEFRTYINNNPGVYLKLFYRDY